MHLVNLAIISDGRKPIAKWIREDVLRRVNKTIADLLESGELKEEELRYLCVVAYVTRKGFLGSKVEVTINYCKIDISEAMGELNGLTK